MKSRYKFEDWHADLETWYRKGVTASIESTDFAHYFSRRYPDTGLHREIGTRLWIALVFLESYMPELVQADVARLDRTGNACLTPTLSAALYHAMLSFPNDSRFRFSDLTQILEFCGKHASA